MLRLTPIKAMIIVILIARPVELCFHIRKGLAMERLLSAVTHTIAYAEVNTQKVHKQAQRLDSQGTSELVIRSDVFIMTDNVKIAS
uniref:Secreted protein n=1 Tax=Arion vulgaris TaxID=1028688 RepID=A0A0B6ZAL1_9EUPU